MFDALEVWYLRALAARGVLWLCRFREERIWDRVAGAIPERAIVSRRYRRGALWLELARSGAHWRLWIRGGRHVPELGLLEQRVEPGWRIVDVGANIGYLALALSERVGEAGEVVCLEPDADNLRELRRNLVCNEIANVRLIPAAAGSRRGVVRFHPGLNGAVATDGAVEIEMVALDGLGLDRVNLIKIDVEGLEGEVLEGAAELIESERPDLFVEVHVCMAAGWSQTRVLDWVRERYSLVRAFERVPETGFMGKVARRYLRAPAFRAVDLSALRSECCSGGRGDLFWLWAEGRRSEEAERRAPGSLKGTA